MHHRTKRSILGSLVSFGVAFVLISTAGAASAQEAPPATSTDEATLGEPQYVERPAPRPDPANELGAAPAPADPTPAPAATPAPAPAQPTPAPAAPAPRSPRATAAPQAASVPRSRPAAPAPRAASAPARATEVQGVQVVRPAVPGDGTETALAFTGVDREVGLTVLAGVLLALGWALIRLSRSPRLA